MERKWWTLIAVCLGTFMLLLDVTIVVVAQPAIQDGLHAGFSDVQWILDAYALTLASLLLIGGLGAASYRVVARIPRRALQMFVGALLTTFGTFWAGEGLRVGWPGNDLSLLWLGALYVAAALVLVRVASDWRRGMAQRPRVKQPATEGVGR